MFERIQKPSSPTQDWASIAQQARVLSSQLEQGQASTPCTDAFAGLIDDSSFNKLDANAKGLWLQTGLKAFAERLQREGVRLKERMSRIDGANKSASIKPSNSERDIPKFKEGLTQGLARIEKDLGLKSERALQPLGKWASLVREIASSLQCNDLEKTQTSSMLKLGVNARHLAKINRRIEHALRQDLTVDIASVNRQVEQIVREHIGGNTIASVDTGDPAFPVLKDQSIWPAVENLMAVGKETEIELVRRGFFDVLTAGRQKVFIVIMFVSLMGRMGMPNLFQTGGSKVAFGVFLAAVMLGSMVNSILLWRREKLIQSEREIAKIRESLFNEACKVIEQVEKVKLSVVRDFLKEVATRIEVQAKQRCDELVIFRRNQVEDEVRMREQAKRGLESRSKLVIEIDRQLTKLIEASQTLMLPPPEAATTAVTRATETANHQERVDKKTSALLERRRMRQEALQNVECT